MRINDRQTIVRHFETKKAQASQGLSKTSSVNSVSSVAQSNTLLTTQFMTNPRARTITQNVLPPALSPPTDERLARCIDDAYREVFNGSQFPTGQQRTDWMKMARDMRAQGKSANDVQMAIRDQLCLQKQGLGSTDNGTLNRLIDQAFKNELGRAPTSAEREKYLKAAQDLAKGGTDAQHIGYAMDDMATTQKLGLDNTNDSTLNRLIDQAFQNELGRAPTSAERQKYLKAAQDLAKGGTDARHIGYALDDMATTQKLGLDNTNDSTLNRLIDQAFKNELGRAPTSAERQKYLKAAQDLAKNGTDARNIGYALDDMATNQKLGLDNTNDSTLNRLIDQAFQNELGRAPTSAERQKYLKAAQDLAKGGTDARHIGYALDDMATNQKLGLDNTDDSTLNRLIDQAFVDAFKGSHAPNASERSAWLKFAQDLAKGGTDARHIGYALSDALATSLNNL